MRVHDLMQDIRDAVFSIWGVAFVVALLTVAGTLLLRCKKNKKGVK